MVNPLITIVFDLFLIGSAASIVAAMAVEYRASQGAVIGRAQSAYRAREFASQRLLRDGCDALDGCAQPSERLGRGASAGAR